MSPTIELPRDLGRALEAVESVDRRRACMRCPARLRTICAPVPVEAIGRLAQLKLPPRRLLAGQPIYAEGDPCSAYFTVLFGWVALTAVQDDGARIVLDYALSGDFFGFQPNPAAPRLHSAIAVTDVTACPLPRRGAEALLQSEPAVAAHLAHLVAVHEARAHDHLVNSLGRGARERVAHFLIEIFFRQTHHLPHQPDEVVELPLTLALMGETIGLTAAHLSRTLRRLREEGVIRFRRGQLHICDPDALLAASGVDRRPLPDEAMEA